VTVHPSATVVLLRDGAAGLEILYLRRSSKLNFHGGAWVFPGGRIDPGDYPEPETDDVTAAARRAAVREAEEEAGLRLDPGALVPFSRWTTPEGLPKRFHTWFFAAPAGGGEVRIDGGEIREYRWMRPEQALAAQRAGEIELPPPTFVTTLTLASHSSADGALSVLAAGPVRDFVPRVRRIGDGACCLYQEDAGYERVDVDASGTRHRLWILKSGWRYERSD
jgi:8-oxo-dGTP pyrophosphatase MutT (NUDIX family)